MNSVNPEKIKIINKTLLISGVLLITWFFISSFSIALQNTLSNDDAMLASIPKNFLNGLPWSTYYGEIIPFNPDTTTGPALLIPALFLQIVFGNVFWIPAVTALLLHITLSLFLARQLFQLSDQKHLAVFCVFLSLIITTGTSFTNYSAYCTTTLWFLFTLAYSLNNNNTVKKQMLVLGVGCCLTLYTKPIGISCFIVCVPFVILNTKDYSAKNLIKRLSLFALGFMIIFSPWHLYKSYELSTYSEEYRTAHKEYGIKFFESHGSGIAQFKQQQNLGEYLKKNTIINYRLLNNSLKERYGLGIIFILILLSLMSIFLIKKLREKPKPFLIYLLLIHLCVLAQTIWFTVFSFSVTAGHSYYIQVLWVVALLLSLSTLPHKSWQAALIIVFCSYLVTQDKDRISKSLSPFHKATIISQTELEKIIPFIQSQKFNAPLAGCGWTIMPKVVDYLLPKPGNFKDCNHLIMDALRKTDNGFEWKEPVRFTGVFLYPLVPFLLPSEQKLYAPILKECFKNKIFMDKVHIVCPIDISKITDFPEPNIAAELVWQAQQRFRTRILPFTPPENW